MIWNFDKKSVVLNREIPQTLASKLVWLVGHDRQGAVTVRVPTSDMSLRRVGKIVPTALE